MYRISRFQEIIKTLPRGAFDCVVEEQKGDKYSKKFRRWDHLLAMVYAQLAGTGSLRQLETGFNSHVAHHYHLDTGCIKRSTLADANSKGRDAVFSEIVKLLMHQVSRSIRTDIKDMLYLLDSTSLTLKGPGFDPWTKPTRTRRTQGIKLHVLLAAKTNAPIWIDFSAPNVNDIDKGVELAIEPGATYVFDKAYCDYNWWHSIDNAGARFVTRFKKNAAVKVEQELPIPDEVKHIVLYDRIVRFKYKKQSGGRINHYTKPLRYLTIARPDKPTPLILATNDISSSAQEVAQYYKDRWQIELFFKWIKQHLKIKQFLGRTENAVRTQILTALIAYLMVALYKQAHGMKQSMWQCLCLIRATLFQRPEIEESNYRKRRREREIEATRQAVLFP